VNPLEQSLPSKGIILSCIRCGCMEVLLTEYVHKYGFNTLPLYTDTNCLPAASILKRCNYLSQQKLDSLYEQNYNIILFKKRSGKMYYRVMNTNEVMSFKKIKEGFFKE